MQGLIIHFCGERHELAAGVPYTIGRDADLVIDDNPYLHRHFLKIEERDQIHWLVNSGSQLAATVTDADGAMQAWLAPGGHLPIVFEWTMVRFTAGSTTYELEIELIDPPFTPVPPEGSSHGTTTVGLVPLTADQRLLIIALAEHVLLGNARSGASVPTSAEAAGRLGWNLTKFNRKLDNVCEKLARSGVQGLHGSPGSLASSRKGRLIEFAIAVRLVEADDLALLPLPAATVVKQPN